MFESFERIFGTERLMTIDEERQQKAMLLLEFDELKQQQGLLRAQMGKHAEDCDRLAKRLRDACRDTITTIQPIDPKWFESEGAKIAETLAKLEIARTRLFEKAQQLREAGLGHTIGN